jgi:hypothetical protein
MSTESREFVVTGLRWFTISLMPLMTRYAKLWMSAVTLGHVSLQLMFASIDAFVVLVFSVPKVNSIVRVCLLLKLRLQLVLVNSSILILRALVVTCVTSILLMSTVVMFKLLQSRR